MVLVMLARNFKGPFFRLGRKDLFMAASLTRKDYISNSIIIQLMGIATSTFLCEIPYDDLLDVNIFIEITPDGNEIRIGINR